MNERNIYFKCFNFCLKTDAIFSVKGTNENVKQALWACKIPYICQNKKAPKDMHGLFIGKNPMF